MKAANKTRQDNNVIRTQGKTKLLTGKICDRQTDKQTDKQMDKLLTDIIIRILQIS